MSQGGDDDDWTLFEDGNAWEEMKEENKGDDGGVWFSAGDVGVRMGGGSDLLEWMESWGIVVIGSQVTVGSM